MNDIRRTILLVIFGFSLVMLWDQWQVHNGKQPTFLPSSRPAASAAAPAQPGTALPSVASAGSAPVFAAFPDNPDEMILHHKTLEAMLDGTYWASLETAISKPEEFTPNSFAVW